MSSSPIVVLILAIFAPIIGGFIYGAERVLRARMQNRMGPPLLQPFYDLFKLSDKRVMFVHSYHASLGVLHFITAWFATALIIFGFDLVLVIFAHLLSSAILVMAGYSTRSIFSHIGSTRELISLLSYEPLFILSAVGFFLLYGSFEVSSFQQDGILPIVSMPLLFIATIVGILIKLKKSPFDAAEAHQEIIGGAEIEYSGIFYEAVYSAKWLEYLYLYAFVYLFGGGSFIIGLLLCLFVFLVVNLIDNSTSRINYKDMLKIVYKYIFPLAVLNLIFIIY